MRITPRLCAAARLVALCSTVALVGCDDGYDCGAICTPEFLDVRTKGMALGRSLVAQRAEASANLASVNGMGASLVGKGPTSIALRIQRQRYDLPNPSNLVIRTDGTESQPTEVRSWSHASIAPEVELTQRVVSLKNNAGEAIGALSVSWSGAILPKLPSTTGGEGSNDVAWAYGAQLNVNRERAYLPQISAGAFRGHVPTFKYEFPAMQTQDGRVARVMITGASGTGKGFQLSLAKHFGQVGVQVRRASEWIDGDFSYQAVVGAHTGVSETGFQTRRTNTAAGLSVQLGGVTLEGEYGWSTGGGPTGLSNAGYDALIGRGRNTLSIGVRYP